MWHHTGVLFQQMRQHVHDLNVRSLSDELLMSTIRDAIPLEISTLRIPYSAQLALVGIMRKQLEALEGGWASAYVAGGGTDVG